ncbi:MAG: ferrous iron transporter B, partial [Spirochaetales bacterium]|nr:ferrous iron transporter B [Spirochaetales bacterium]
MGIRIALAGNPNSGKTTLFNALTGSNQFVGNWPGVTVEKKEGKLKKHNDVVITDLPGIYSLSPYTLEEVVARNYLVGERPDAILNIVDGTNLERNLYLTTQLVELGIPVVIAINMIDIVKKRGDKIDLGALSKELGCPVVDISALKGTGIDKAAEAAIDAARGGRKVPMHTFSGPVEHALAHIEEAVVHNMPEDMQRWYAIKVFERDKKVLEQLKISKSTMEHVEQDIVAAEKELDDDSEAIITNERYIYIAQIIKGCYKKKNNGKLSTSDKIDRVVTNRWLGLPIFAAIMFLVYYIAMVTVGTAATDWANDGLFGDGYFLLGIGRPAYDDASGEFGDASNVLDAFVGIEDDADYNDVIAAARKVPAGTSADYVLVDEETLAPEDVTYTYDDLQNAIEVYGRCKGEEPDPADYGVWVPGIPVLVGNLLEKMNT